MLLTVLIIVLFLTGLVLRYRWHREVVRNMGGLLGWTEAEADRIAFRLMLVVIAVVLLALLLANAM